MNDQIAVMLALGVMCACSAAFALMLPGLAVEVGRGEGVAGGLGDRGDVGAPRAAAEERLLAERRPRVERGEPVALRRTADRHLDPPAAKEEDVVRRLALRDDALTRGEVQPPGEPGQRLELVPLEPRHEGMGVERDFGSGRGWENQANQTWRHEERSVSGRCGLRKTTLTTQPCSFGVSLSC